MADTRTWLTTPVGASPADDDRSTEHWMAGPSIPTEPRPPFRFRGAVGLLVALAVVIGLTFALAPSFFDTQDPTFSGQQQG